MTLEKDLKLLADLKASRDDLETRIKELEGKIKTELNKWGVPFEKEVEKYIPYYPYTIIYPNTTPCKPTWQGTTYTSGISSGSITHNFTIK